MAAQYKTQCPHCGAQFRISEQHLAQAKGAVRCGSCLKVFQATEHLVDSPAATPSKSAESAAPAEKWSLTEEPPAKLEPKKPTAASKRWTMEDDLSDDMAEDMPDELVDEPVPSNLQANDTKMSLGGLELSDSFMSLDGDDDDNLHNENFSDMAGAGKKMHSEDSDESWAEKLLEELEEGDKPAPAEVRADRMSLTERDEDQSRREEQEKKKQRTSQTSQEQSTDMPDWAVDSGDFFSDASLGILSEDSDDLVAIDIPVIEERKTSRPSLPLDGSNGLGGDLLKWGALSLAALLVLVSQYLIFNFHELSRTPAWRPFYTNICGAFGCNLPNPSDVTKLRGANLVVRAHPQIAEALVVDVIVFNESRYAQPFPLLELGFTSVNGRAIASRRFRPEEYLRGDLKAMTAMPADVPIRLSLEILDPGSEAQNYTLRFFPVPQ